jgi:hypothetical protein
MNRSREILAARAIQQEFVSHTLADLNRRWQAAVRQDAFLCGTEPRSDKHRQARVLKQALSVALNLRSGDTIHNVFVPNMALAAYAPIEAVEVSKP